MLVVVATIGTPETRRKLAPYGLLKPGMLWLALFYLAPLFTLLRLSLSTLPSRFAVEAEFDWNLDNYVTAFTDFGPQFQRAFIYAGTATILTIVIGYPLAYVIAFRGRQVPHADARPGRHPVLHVVPDPHDRLAQHPVRRRGCHRVHRCRSGSRGSSKPPTSWTTDA